MKLASKAAEVSSLFAKLNLYLPIKVPNVKKRRN